MAYCIIWRIVLYGVLYYMAYCIIWRIVLYGVLYYMAYCVYEVKLLFKIGMIRMLDSLLGLIVLF